VVVGVTCGVAVIRNGKLHAKLIIRVDTRTRKTVFFNFSFLSVKELIRPGLERVYPRGKRKSICGKTPARFRIRVLMPKHSGGNGYL